MEGIVVPVFVLKVNTNLFIISIPPNMIAQAQKATSSALHKLSLTLKEVQSLMEFVSFCAEAVQLRRIFVHSLWDFIVQYLSASLQFTRKCLPSKIYKAFI